MSEYKKTAPIPDGPDSVDGKPQDPLAKIRQGSTNPVRKFLDSGPDESYTEAAKKRGDIPR